jgi:hypothetical protein
MNYKVMQRPMFRLGGSARKNYNTGTSLADIEKLINERAALRSKAFGGIRTMLPFSVLASQMDDIRTIRKPRDVLNILSNIGGSQELIGALTKLPGIDLKEKEGELTDKITLAKLKQQSTKSTDYLRKKEDLKLIQAKEDQIRADVAKLDKNSPTYADDYKKLQRDFEKLREQKQQTLSRMLTREDAEREYIKDYKESIGVMPTQEQIDEHLRSKGFLASGGRVGYQQGTPNPMVMPQPKPQEAVQDRELDTLMDAAPALEDPNEAKSMGEKDMYNALRRRLPKEISDDVVRLIAYNQEAFADFANISDQSDVESFNQKYNVELVLPVGNQ